jgi:hypothetical protein
MKEQIQARMDEIKKAIDESVINHNALLVRYNEAEHLLKLAEECCAKDVCEAEIICEEVQVSE